MERTLTRMYCIFPEDVQKAGSRYLELYDGRSIYYNQTRILIPTQGPAHVRGLEQESEFIDTVSEGILVSFDEDYEDDLASPFLYKGDDGNKRHCHYIYAEIGIGQDTKGKATTGGTKMAEKENMLQTVMSMQMLKSVMKDGDMDLGKVYLMQQLTKGEPMKVTEVIKAKLISKFKLDGDKDTLDIDQLMLLQMLEQGELDIAQLMAMRMMKDMFKDDEKKKS